jgi:hypothetical protein
MRVPACAVPGEVEDPAKGHRTLKNHDKPGSHESVGRVQGPN